MKPTTATAKSPASEDEDDLKGDDKKEAEKNNEAARLWISGLEAVKRKFGVARVIDLSATPFFLRGSGYAEGTLFPWTMSDFSLMDAIECGIVKLPRVPVADNIPGGEMPMFRNLWEIFAPRCRRRGAAKASNLIRSSLPAQLQTALDALYGHYEKTFELWRESRHHGATLLHRRLQQHRPRRNWSTTTSPASTRRPKMAHDELANGRLELFRNYDDYGNRLPRPRTLLIDSEQLESGEALDDNFRTIASDEIERFRREIIERTGDPDGREAHRPGPAARGHEHGRQVG